jgi:hypothetical protein
VHLHVKVPFVISINFIFAVQQRGLHTINTIIAFAFDPLTQTQSKAHTSSPHSASWKRCSCSINGRGHKHGQRLSVKLLLSELCSLSPLRFHLNRASSQEHIRISSSGCPLLLQKENKPFGSRILYSIEHYCSPRTCSLLPVAIFFFYIEAAALFVDRAASRGQFPDLLMPIRIMGMLRLSLPLSPSRCTVHSKLKPLRYLLPG